jgi:hypothetical protein
MKYLLVSVVAVSVLLVGGKAGVDAAARSKRKPNSCDGTD